MKNTNYNEVKGNLPEPAQPLDDFPDPNILIGDLDCQIVQYGKTPQQLSVLLSFRHVSNQEDKDTGDPFHLLCPDFQAFLRFLRSTSRRLDPTLDDQILATLRQIQDLFEKME